MYSSRRRGDNKKAETAKAKAQNPQPLAELEPEPKPQSSLSWARCMKRVYEIDPLECPRCKCQMRIVAFVQDPVEIKKIMQSQGIPDFTAPPPIPKVFEAPETDFIPDYESSDY